MEYPPGRWTAGFGLKSQIYLGCAVKISKDEVVTISGSNEAKRLMYLYNVRTGKVLKYKDPAPTPVSGCTFGTLIFLNKGAKQRWD